MTSILILLGIRRVAQRKRQRPREAGRGRQVRRLPRGARVRPRQHPPRPGAARHRGGLLQVRSRGQVIIIYLINHHDNRIEALKAQCQMKNIILPAHCQQIAMWVIL